jgi:hypothetical protein
MTFKVYIKQKHDKRFVMIDKTEKPQRAEITAMSWCNRSEHVKVICDDGYTTETITYK